MAKATNPPENRLLVSRTETRRMLGNIGITKELELEAAGELEVVRIGRRVLITADSAHAYVARLRKAATR